jgi:hypothetical protein
MTALTIDNIVVVPVRSGVGKYAFLKQYVLDVSAQQTLLQQPHRLRFGERTSKAKTWPDSPACSPAGCAG